MALKLKLYVVIHASAQFVIMVPMNGIQNEPLAMLKSVPRGCGNPRLSL